MSLKELHEGDVLFFKDNFYVVDEIDLYFGMIGVITFSDSHCYRQFFEDDIDEMVKANEKETIFYNPVLRSSLLAADGKIRSEIYDKLRNKYSHVNRKEEMV